MPPGSSDDSKLDATLVLDSNPPRAGSAPSGASSSSRPTIGRFTVIRPIGAGGMGAVFEAYDGQLDRKVALKVLPRGLDLSLRDRQRMLREAKALARISHPNVVAVFDAGEYDDEVFIAMELVQGFTVQQWLAERPRSWAEILEVFIMLGQGLLAMHERGMIHRDFKPSNAIVDQDGRARLIDFGLARHEQRPDEDEPGPPGSSQRLDAVTRPGAVVGTAMYMSPEQFQGLPATAASDQFSLCVALYEAVYGISPFVGRTRKARALSVLSGQIEPPPRPSSAPAELRAVIGRGLRTDANERWPGLAELLDALRGLLASHDPELEGPLGVRRRQRLLLAFAAMGTLAAVGFSAMLMNGLLSVTPRTIAIIDASVLASLVGVTAITYPSWKRFKQHRRFVQLLLMLFTLYFVNQVVGALVGRSVYHSSVANITTAATISAFATSLFGRILWWAMAWALIGLLLMLVDPSRFFIYFGLAHIGALIFGILLTPRRSVQRWIRVAARQGSETPPRTPVLDTASGWLRSSSRNS